MIDLDRLLIGPCMQVFGELVVYTAKGQTSISITGVFDRVNLQQQPMGGNAQESAKSGAGGNVTALRTVLGVRLADFPLGAPKQNDRIAIPARALSFAIQECRPDGQGWAMLILTKAA